MEGGGDLQEYRFRAHAAPAGGSRKQDKKSREAGLKMARDRFYKGDIAREMAKFSEQNGGLLRYEDFASYTVKEEEPVSVNYRGYEVYKNPSASQGPAELFMLNILEGYDLKLMGQTAPIIHISVEAIKLAMADRDKYLGDMDFIRIPYAGLLSKDYAEQDATHLGRKPRSTFGPGNRRNIRRASSRWNAPRDVEIAGGATTRATPATSPWWTGIATPSPSRQACTAASEPKSSWASWGLL